MAANLSRLERGCWSDVHALCTLTAPGILQYTGCWVGGSARAVLKNKEGKREKQEEQHSSLIFVVAKMSPFYMTCFLDSHKG